MRVYMMCLFFIEWFSLHFVYTAGKCQSLVENVDSDFLLNPTVKVIHQSYRDCL